MARWRGCFDAIIYATARLQKVPLVTCDTHFRDLPEVVYHSKKTPT